ncbi:RNP-1 like protein RNA-binding protein [Histomonas meleagridis]|uniref:RNP-1 like protein RNA-binding protein n=1 Tax=Histomonas meleagridis TaxID=135588 RepID=UPI003559F2A9|nr:RNP-1 like protein RNA-binding protein [Histomonas meleagridis]KAH0800397.1 RNP-1 like protein RNA-binding protein [Histomonas meleagridis]
MSKENSEHEDTSNEITLYVSGLPNESTQDELDKFFGDKAPLVCVCLRKDRRTGHFTGTCFVTYKNREDGLKIISELNESEYKGKKLIVEQSRRPYIHNYSKVVEEQRRNYDRYRERDDPRYRDYPYRSERYRYERERYDPRYDRYRYDDYERRRMYYDDPPYYSRSRYDDPYIERRRYPRRPPSDESDH